MDEVTKCCDAFDFAKENNYGAYLQQDKHYGLIWFMKESGVGVDSRKWKEIKDVKIISREDIIQRARFKNIFFHSPDDDFKSNFFIYMFNKYKNDLVVQQELLESFGSYINKDSKIGLSILNKVCGDNKSLIKSLNITAINNIKNFDLKDTDMNDFDALFKSRSVSADIVEKFYFRFFKSRKTSLKNAFIGPKIKDFLMEKYNGDRKKLEPYFPFFNNIKYEFEDLSLNIAQPGTEHVCAVRINSRELSQTLCLPGFNEGGIHLLIKKLCQGLSEVLSSQFVCDDINRSKSLYEYRFYSKKELKQEEIVSIIKDFLLFKKSNLELDVDESVVSKWYFERELRKDLDVSKTNSKQKVKI